MKKLMHISFPSYFQHDLKLDHFHFEALVLVAKMNIALNLFENIFPWEILHLNIKAFFSFEAIKRKRFLSNKTKLVRITHGFGEDGNFLR